MSLKRNCDGCGAIIPDDKRDDEYPDLMVFIGDSESPAYEYEDLCPKCMDRIVCAIENALIDKEDAPKPLPPRIEPATAEPEKQPIAIESEPDEIEVPDIAEQPEERHYANGVVRQFPIKSARTNQ